MKTTRDFRKPTKNDSLFMLKQSGFYPKTIFDIGGGEMGTDSLSTNFRDSKHVIFEPVKDRAEKLTNWYTNRQKLKDFEIIIEELSNKPPHNLNYFAELKPYKDPYLIKIDVDGNDYLILNGATKVLDKTDCVIVETNIFRFFLKDDSPLAQRDVINFVNFLDEYGFFLFDITDPCYTSGFLTNVDLIFYKKDKFNKATMRPDYSAQNKLQRIFLENNKPSKDLDAYIAQT